MNKYERFINHEKIKFETCDKADREYRAGRLDLLTSPYISKIFEKAQKYDEMMAAKKPKHIISEVLDIDYYICEKCSSTVTTDILHCYNCGQRIDWSE